MPKYNQGLNIKYNGQSNNSVISCVCILGIWWCGYNSIEMESLGARLLHLHSRRYHRGLGWSDSRANDRRGRWVSRPIGCLAWPFRSHLRSCPITTATGGGQDSLHRVCFRRRHFEDFQSGRLANWNPLIRTPFPVSCKFHYPTLTEQHSAHHKWWICWPFKNFMNANNSLGVERMVFIGCLLHIRDNAMLAWHALI